MYNQLVIVIFLLVLRLSNPLVHYNVLIVYTSYLTLSYQKFINHTLIYIINAHVHYYLPTHCHPCHIVQSSIFFTLL